MQTNCAPGVLIQTSLPSNTPRGMPCQSISGEAPYMSAFLPILPSACIQNFSFSPFSPFPTPLKLQLASTAPSGLGWPVMSTRPRPHPVPEGFLYSPFLTVQRTRTFPTLVLAILLSSLYLWFSAFPMDYRLCKDRTIICVDRH